MGDVRPLMYGELAGWFHLLTAPAEYEAEAAEVLALLRNAASGQVRTALELGSGGGNLASHLRDDLELTLTDAAPGMLALSERLNPGVEHIQADMRDMRLDRTFDAVIAHDAITYMTDTDQLRAAFDTAWVHLRPGGAAVFMPDWVLDTFEPETESGGNDDGQRGLRFLEWDGPVGPDGHTVTTDYVIVTRDGSTSAVYHDVHELGIFPRATWLQTLSDVGFEARRVDGEQGIDLFVATRPG